MRRLLNTLYVTSPDSYLSRDGTNVVVSVSGREVGRVPVQNLEQVVAFNHAGASPGMMRLCAESGVTISFHTPSGRFLASVEGEARGNVLLRREQFRMADDPLRSLPVARNMIYAKAVNCSNLVRKGLRNHGSLLDRRTAEVANHLYEVTRSIPGAASMDELRGLEGDAARTYFVMLDRLILRHKDLFFMRERSRRPPRDRFNALLSFTYVMLMNDVRSALSSVGLDPFVGFMHTDRPGRPSLALDVMEEFRSEADRMVLRLINLGMVDPDGFVEMDGGAVMMDDDIRRKVISEWQASKRTEVTHPFTGERMPVGMVPHIQAKLLAKHVRGEIDGYPPYIRKVARG